MKRLCTLILTILIAPQCFAPHAEASTYLYVTHYHNRAIDDLKLKVLKAIIAVERPKTPQQAVEAKRRENAVGILQIRPIAVQEVNRILGYQKYILADRNDSVKSVKMFFIIQNYHNPSFNPQKAAYIWNGGSSYMKANKQQWKRLNHYWYLVNKQLK